MNETPPPGGDRWVEVDAIFTQALDLEPAARAAFLDERCRDGETRAWVESLLREAESDTHSIGEGGAMQGALGMAFARASGSPEEPPPPPDIPGFRMVRPLGAGGMGVVWLAEQLEPVRRPVAIKIIRGGMVSAHAVARFESERQALALMSHPNIARVFDGGSTPDGHPYFLMEYVSGLPITEHCRVRSLSVRERLELMLPVCEAVHHAHLRGIIHRDLKPSNVLIAEEQGRAVPKVIDFGIARALEQRLTEQTVQTQHGQILGTPEYMSPEQAQLGPADVDARSDVFALGIMLYEILTGTRPFRSGSEDTASLDRLFQRIRHEDPPRPSQRLAADRVTSGRTATGTAVRELRGDLDWIVMKALEKDRANRYGSSRELADDLQRHLRHEPVVAGPPSTAYRLRKLARRHRGAVVAGALIVLALVLGTGISIWQSVLARRAERTALREAETARRVTDFVVELFQAPDPSRARGDTVTAREILDRGRERLRAEIGGDPGVRARLMGVVAETYRKLGLYAEAESLFLDTIALRVTTAGEDDLEVARARHALGRLAIDRGQDLRADSLFRLALVRYARSPEETALDEAQALQDLSESVRRRGNYPEAESLALRSVRMFESRIADPDDDRIAAGWQAVGTTQARQGRFAEAERSFLHALELFERKLGPDHPDLATDLANLVSVVGAQGREAEAEAYGRRALAILEKAYGPEHRFVASALTNLAGSLGRQGRVDEAREMFERALAIRRKVYGDDDPQTVIGYGNLGLTCMLQGDYREAERWLDRALQIDLRTYGPRHPRISFSRSVMGAIQRHLGRLDEAERQFRAGIASLEGNLGPESPEAARCYRGLGEIALARGRWADADSQLTRARRIFEARAGARSAELVSTVRLLGELRLAEGRIDRAVARIEESGRIAAGAYGRNDHPAFVQYRIQLGRARARQGDLAAADSLFQGAVALSEKTQGRAHPDLAEALHERGVMLAGAGRTDEARECLDRALEVRVRRLGAAHPESRATERARAALGPPQS